MINVLLVDNHPLFREGVARLLADAPGITLSGSARDGAEACTMAMDIKPDVLLLDVHLPGMSGIETARKIMKHNPEVRVVFLTDSDSPVDLFAALRCGARGYLLKDTTSQTLIESIHHIHAGDAVLHPRITAILINEFNILAKGADLSKKMQQQAEDSALTERELDVLRLVARGLSNKEIGEQLDISPHTVKSHLSHMMEKLQLNGRVEATAWAIRHGLLREG